MPRIPFSFDPLRRSLYSRQELFGAFNQDEPQSFARTADFAIYREYILAGKDAPADYFTAMMQALHDNSITQAVRDFLKSGDSRAVGVMGGHKLERGSAPYKAVVSLSRELSNRGFLMMSGGGPGAMEATHLGALLRMATGEEVAAAIQRLSGQPAVPDLRKLINPDGSLNENLVAEAHAWFAPAHHIASQVKNPGESLAIPTWLYGYEPSSPLATRIGKYFQNSIREEGLLALATNGVIYAEGRAGTLQEVFQDAAQNYYRTFDDKFSPMVFLGETFWTKTIPAVSVLQALFAAEDFKEYVLVTDDVSQAVAFIESLGTKETSAERISKYLAHEVHGREA
jgi:predicted Rossmann-fold nucleotide-binding protein